MSGWHRDNPELCGTEADPWMQIPSHRKLILGLDDVDLNRLADMREAEVQQEDES